MAIPLFILRALPRLRRREMYAIGFVFLLGLVCVVAAIVRFIFLWRFMYGKSLPSHQLPSQQNIIVYTSELEVVVAVVAGCLPALRVLLRRPSRNGTQHSSTMQSAALHSIGHGGGGFPVIKPPPTARKSSSGPLPGKPLTTDERAFHTREKQYNSPTSGNPTLAVGF